MNKRDQGRADKRDAKLLQKEEDLKTIRSVVSNKNTSALDITKDSGKATSLVSYKRTTEVVKLILRGVRYTDIMEYCEAHWGIKRRMASIYYKKALETFAEQFSEEREYEMDKHAIMLQDLYSQGYKAGDLNICRLLLQDIAKMKGIVIDRVDVTSGGEGFVFNYKPPVEQT
jgi:hypothetical protein|tara:strand:- start:1338 stop:1853 length:516 start_codon:yes stop_codon:yes gene_type:complete